MNTSFIFVTSLNVYGLCYYYSVEWDIAYGLQY